MIKWMMVAIIVIAVVIWCLIEQHLLVCHRGYAIAGAASRMGKHENRTY